MNTTRSALEILIADSPDLLEQCFAIRHEVFVGEQQVNPDEEIDTYESLARHFLARQGGQAVATARWRHTPKGIKLERFAVIKACRGSGIGRLLLEAVLDDIALNNVDQQPVYLHAQLTATALYRGQGFVPIGPEFKECGIHHVKMLLQDHPAVSDN